MNLSLPSLPFGKPCLSKVVCVIALCPAAVIASPAQSFTTIHSFPPGGTQPSAGLILDRLGDLYGTAPFGGDHGKGTVFTILSNGTFMLLHSFNGSDGSGPGAILIGSDGYVYGTTYSGGTSSNCDGGCGTVYKLTDDRPVATSIAERNYGRRC